MRNRFLFMIVFLVVVLLSGCAKQGMPSGGPKDTEPPKLKRAMPESRSLGFADNQFYIEFDEYVVLKDADNNVLVSPPMKNKPEIKTKGKGVQVKINDTLAENTTYQFQFKDAIADYNEGNLLPSMEYVFSTGNYIDSMTVRGRVVDALTLKPREEMVSVWLMHPSDAEEFVTSFGDSAAQAPKLAYVTRCNKDGSFSFNYIKAGEYRVFAVQDEDKNRLLGPSESVAFMDGTVKTRSMTDSVVKDSVVLQIYTPDVDKQRIMSGDFKSSGKVLVTTLLPMDAPVIDGGGEELIWRLNDKRDTLTLWTLRENCDSLQMVVNDATGISDTLKLRWRPKKVRGKPISQLQLGSGFEMKLNYKALPFYDTLSLKFNTPLGGLSVVRDSLVRVMYLKDSSLTYCAVAVDNSLMSARIEYDFKQGEKYKVMIAKGCFKDIYDRDNDSLSADVSVTKAEEYGNLEVEVTDSTLLLPPRYITIVQLLDEKGAVVASKNALANVLKTPFPHLKPGKYRVRAINDENHNGKWDKGDFAAGIQPERVVYLPKTLDIRANWDFEEKLELSK